MLITRYQLEAWRFTSTDESRAALQCLRLGPEPRTVWATNAAYAVKVEVLAELNEADFPVIPGVTWQEAKDGESILLPTKTAKAALKAQKAQKAVARSFPVLQCARVGLEAGTGEAPAHVVVAVTDLERPTVFRARVSNAAAFPKVAHLFDEFELKALNAPIGLSRRYVADIGGYAALFERGARSAAVVIKWEFAGPLKSVRFSWEDDEHRVTGLLMPIQI